MVLRMQDLMEVGTRSRAANVHEGVAPADGGGHFRGYAPSARCQ